MQLRRGKVKISTKKTKAQQLPTMPWSQQFLKIVKRGRKTLICGARMQQLHGVNPFVFLHWKIVSVTWKKHQNCCFLPSVQKRTCRIQSHLHAINSLIWRPPQAEEWKHSHSIYGFTRQMIMTCVMLSRPIWGSVNENSKCRQTCSAPCRFAQLTAVHALDVNVPLPPSSSPVSTVHKFTHLCVLQRLFTAKLRKIRFLPASAPAVMASEVAFLAHFLPLSVLYKKKNSNHA